MLNEANYREAERRLWQHVGVAPDERRIEFKGLGVRVQTVGSGAPVLFIHGGPNSGSTWAPILPYLGGFACWLVDRPGTGLSDDFVLTHDAQGFARTFVPTILDALNLPQAHIVASSFGGYLALQSASAAPDRILRMVQMACPAFVPGMKTPGFMRAMMLRPVRRIMNALPPNDKVGRSILRQIGHGASLDQGRIPEVFFEWYLALQKYTNTMRNEGEMIGSAGTVRGFDRAMTLSDELLHSISTPTLFLWGADDRFGDEAVARKVTGLMPAAELRMMPESGHLPWLDDPESIGRATADFLAQRGTYDRARMPDRAA